MAGARQLSVITRRAVVRALPAVALMPLPSGTVSASGAASRSGIPAELPSDRVARLARELADALNEVDGSKWFATIYPSDYVEDPIRYADIAETMNAAETVSPELVQAIVSHCTAYAAVARAARLADNVALGHDASPDNLQRLGQESQAERDLLMALCRFPARNDPERHDKAAYLLGFCDNDELEGENVVAMLESMTVPSAPAAQNLDASALGRRV